MCSLSWLAESPAKRCKIVLILLCSVSSGCSNGIAYGERQYAVEPLDMPGQEPFSYPSSTNPPTNIKAERESYYKNVSYSNFAYELKNRSDVMCDKFKLDLALSQTGTNFSANFTNVILGALGGGIGGTVAQATSAATGAVTGFKNTVTSDIYQKITDTISNYIDTSRDEEWTRIQKKFKKSTYISKSEVRNDVQKYHARCS